MRRTFFAYSFIASWGLSSPEATASTAMRASIETAGYSSFIGRKCVKGKKLDAFDKTPHLQVLLIIRNIHTGEHVVRKKGKLKHVFFL